MSLALNMQKAGRRPECRPAVRDLAYQQISALAYQNEALARLEATNRGYRFLEHIHDEATGADAIVLVNDEEVVIAFRGTQKNYADIMTDLKFRKRNFMPSASGTPVFVHRGFAEQWQSVQERVFKVAMAAATGQRRIVSTGHSLGGALAVLCAMTWQLVDTCVTFGAPRVGDPGVRTALRKNNVTHRRYVYGADVVPAVPLMTMSYRHDTRPVYLTRRGKTIPNCPMWREIIGRARGLLTLNWSAGWAMCPIPARMFTDHRIGEYGNAIMRSSRQ